MVSTRTKETNMVCKQLLDSMILTRHGLMSPSSVDSATAKARKVARGTKMESFIVNIETSSRFSLIHGCQSTQSMNLKKITWIMNTFVWVQG